MGINTAGKAPAVSSALRKFIASIIPDGIHQLIDRVHDIRHSAVSLLIDMGFSVLAIGERMGHEAEKITYRYAHLFPSKQKEMASKLDDLSKGALF